MNAFQWLYQWDKLAPQEHIRAHPRPPPLLAAKPGSRPRRRCRAASARASPREAPRAQAQRPRPRRADEPPRHRVDRGPPRRPASRSRARSSSSATTATSSRELATRVVELTPAGRRQGRRDRRLRRHLRGVPRAQGPFGRQKGVIGTVFFRALTKERARYGVEPGSVYDALGVTEALLHDASASVSLDVATRAWLSSRALRAGRLRASRRRDDAARQLRRARICGALSPNAKEALVRAVRFQRVTYAMSNLSFAIDGPST